MRKFVLMAAMLLIPAAAASQGAPAAPKDEKVRCKRIADTGSMVRGRKICRTEREWREMRENSRNNADSLTTPTGHSSTSG